MMRAELRQMSQSTCSKNRNDPSSPSNWGTRTNLNVHTSALQQRFDKTLIGNIGKKKDLFYFLESSKPEIVQCRHNKTEPCIEFNYVHPTQLQRI